MSLRKPKNANLPRDVVETAKQQSIMEARVRDSRFALGTAVAYDEADGVYRFYPADAWTRPRQVGTFPWEPPTDSQGVVLKPIAIVSRTGRIDKFKKGDVEEDTIILYEKGDFWVRKNARGDFEVIRNGFTHGTRCAVIGRGLANAFARAKAECDRRADREVK